MSQKTKAKSVSLPKRVGKALYVSAWTRCKKALVYISIAWTVSSAIVGFFVAVVMKGDDFLLKLERLPAAVDRTWGKYSSWRAEDQQWAGVWSSRAEGYVAGEDMKLSNVDMRLEITAQRGRIGGSVATRELCRALPMFDFVMIEGLANSDLVKVKVYDVIGGKRRDFGELVLRRDGVVMTVSPISGMTGLFPNEARIALHPRSEAFNDDDGKRGEFCKLERDAFHAGLRRQPGR